jgi:bifunctional NMN adenylyltransferase/nudix hydrolase
MISNIGVVVGRFQVDELHEGHVYLLDTVSERSDQLIVVLGTGPLPTTARKPLPFETRKAIIEKLYPKAIIVEHHDHHDDEVWSKELDDLIETVRSVHQLIGPVTLYHSRDSFATYYSGEYKTEEISEADIGISGTIHRRHIAKNPLRTQDFAKGVIWANENRFPTVYGAVDAMIFRDPKEVANPQILLITKKGRDGYMFPGGFTDPFSSSDELDASREVWEECSIIIRHDELSYVGSKNVEDWRYSGENDCIRSRMFLGFSVDPEMEPEAGDDAETAQWVDWKTLKTEDMNPCHQPLLETLQRKLEEV